jgi:hypothetical protein
MTDLEKVLLEQRYVYDRIETNFRNYEPTYRAVVAALDVKIPDYLKYVSLDGYSINIGVAGGPDALHETFKALRACGFELLNKEDRPKEKQSSWSGYFHLPNIPGCKIWLTFSSTKCRRVQIGTRTVEEPIYDTVCDEEENQVQPADPRYGSNPEYIPTESVPEEAAEAQDDGIPF